MRADIRSLTAIAIIGTCAFVLARGLGIVHFSVAMANIESPQARAEIAKTWSSAPDVASSALQADLSYQIDASDQNAANHRRQMLTALVSFQPMSSYDWLSLSGLQFVTDQPIEQVFSSLELSTLTGPNEGHILGERAVFAVSLWDRLPADLKNHVAADVAAMMSPRTPAEGAEIGKLQAVLATQPDWVRSELREAVAATGLSPQDIKDHLGF